MGRCVWYISKYVGMPDASSAGGRGYLLMRELARRGVASVIVTSDSNQLTRVPVLDQPYVFNESEGVQMCWVRTLKYQVAKSARRILSWLDFEWRVWRMPRKHLPRPDVIVVSSLSLLTVLNGFWLRWRYRARLVVEIRDIWPLTIVEEGGFSPRNPMVLGLGLIEKLAYRHADAIVGTMPNLQAHVAEVLGEPRPVACVPMGVDDRLLTEVEPLPADYVAQHIPAGKFVIAHAGTIGITNALDTFLDCARRLRDSPQLHFLVVGEGDLRARYMRDYADVPNLSFAPRVPKRMVQSVLARCNLLYFSVHVSRVWRYGQSLNKVIDYMLAGKPIVASYTGHPSMINEADCGSYVPAGDVDALQAEILRYAAMAPAQLDTIGARGRSWLLQHRRYDVLAADFLKILFPDTTDPVHHRP
jgi:glycosyltransferase involved in cell wall biosynthesis